MGIDKAARKAKEEKVKKILVMAAVLRRRHHHGRGGSNSQLRNRDGRELVGGVGYYVTYMGGC
jgi:hypothetical protein